MHPLSKPLGFRLAVCGGLLASLAIVVGCRPELDPATYGEVIYQLPTVEGADKPYVLPNLEDTPENEAKTVQ